MGGGAAMRVAAAAAKAAGLGPQTTGIRGRLPENFAARSAVRASASATRSVDDTGRIEIAAASQTRSALTWELDDWEFDGFEPEKPRLVFGPAPSLEEATEATSELKDALDKMYFSSSNAAVVSGSSSAIEGHNESSKSESSLSIVSEHSETSEIEDEIADTKICVVNQASVPAPNQALRAYQILSKSPAAQKAVASIASDPNVWDAVLQNEAVKEILQSEKMCMEFAGQDPFGDVADSGDSHDAKKPGNFMMDFAENVKLAVVGWVNNLPGFFQDMFGGLDHKATSGESGPTNWSPSSMVVSGSIIGLAVMVIMVVSLKRG